MIRNIISILVFVVGIYAVNRANYSHKIKRELFGFFSSMTIAEGISMISIVIVYLLNTDKISMDFEVLGYLNAIIAIISQLIRIIGFGFIYRILKGFANTDVSAELP